MGLLRDNLQPTDFADAVCKVTDWNPFDGYTAEGYRIWVCRCGFHWFQRHEWLIKGKNQTQLDEWIYNGMNRTRQFDPHFIHDGLTILSEQLI